MREEKLLFVTEKGMAKQVSGQEFMTANRTVMATKLSEDDRLIHVYAGEEPQIVIQTEEGYFLRFEKEEISEYKKASIGMRGILLSAEDRVKCVYEINPRQEYLLPYHSREIDLAKIKLGGRGQKGTKLRR